MKKKKIVNKLNELYEENIVINTELGDLRQDIDYLTEQNELQDEINDTYAAEIDALKATIEELQRQIDLLTIYIDIEKGKQCMK